MPRFITEINKIGVNINQITATANSTKYVSKEMLLKVSEEREKVIGLLQQILDEVYNIDDHSFQSLENKIDRLTKKQQSRKVADPIDYVLSPENRIIFFSSSAGTPSAT